MFKGILPFRDHLFRLTAQTCPRKLGWNLPSRPRLQDNRIFAL